MAGDAGVTRLERAPLLGRDEIARDAEQGLASSSGETSGRDTDAVRFLGGGDQRWGDAVERQRHRTHRRRLHGAVGAVACTALLALALQVDTRHNTSTSIARLGEFTDGGAWGFGELGTVGTSRLGSSSRAFRDLDENEFQTREDETSVITQHHTTPVPDWVRNVAPFETRRVRVPRNEESFEEEPIEEEPTDPVPIDWLADELEWPLFGSELSIGLDNLDKGMQRVQRGGARVNAHTATQSPFVSVDAGASAGEKRRADARNTRVAERIEERTHDESHATGGALPLTGGGDKTRLTAHTHVGVRPPSQPKRGAGWVNSAGEPTTFSVNVCGVAPFQREKQAPWPACRVLLVGCPGGRSAPDSILTAPPCARWDVSQSLEMRPTEPGNLGSFSVTTSLYGPGDEFAFALVKPGCTDTQIVELLRRQGSGVSSGGASVGDPAVVTGECEVKLDSGFPMGNALSFPGPARDARCWIPPGAGLDGAVSVGDSSEANAKHVVARIGDALCESTLVRPVEARGVSTGATYKKDNYGQTLPDFGTAKSLAFASRGEGTCLLRRDKAYKPKAFHRVVPGAMSKALGVEGAIESLDGEVDDTSPKSKSISFVWGSCDSSPRKEKWCASPTFDPAKVAAVCGVAFVESQTTRDAELGKVNKEPSNMGKPDTKGKPAPGSEKPERTLGEEKEASPPASAVTGPGLAATTPKDGRSRTVASGALDANTNQALLALLAQTEPLLSDASALNAEDAVAAAEADGAVSFRTVPVDTVGKSENRADAGNPPTGKQSGDLFGTDDTEFHFLPPGQWAETPSVPVDLGGSPHAVAHLVLRDGDSRFASEHLPWVVLLVNGETVRAPRQLAKGDLVQLRVRAETTNEIEAREFGDASSSLGISLGSGETPPPGKQSGETIPPGTKGDPVRVATLVVGDRTGSIRVRVEGRRTIVTKAEASKLETAKPVEASSSSATGDAELGPLGNDASSDASSDDAPSDADASSDPDGTTPPPIRQHMTLDGTVPGTTGHVVSVTAPRAGQWMVVPPVDRAAVLISGLGENARNAVTVRFAPPETTDTSESSSVSKQSDSKTPLEKNGSDDRSAPGGEANGVFAKINGVDFAGGHEKEKSDFISVWTRQETMQVARVGTGPSKAAGSQNRVEVKDGDKLRVKIRAPAIGAAPIKVALFVGEFRVGTAVVGTAADDTEAESAGDALDATLRRARTEAVALEHRGKDTANAVGALGETTGQPGASTNQPTDATPYQQDDATPPGAVSASKITGREITVGEMSQTLQRGVTRFVAAGSTVNLPTRGFMTIGGVLPSKELTLLVHAYEQVAGGDIEERAAAASGGEGESVSETPGAPTETQRRNGDENAWRTVTASLGVEADGAKGASTSTFNTDASVGTPPDASTRINAHTDASAYTAYKSASSGAGAGPLPDWVQVRVEGIAQTPPTPVWLARRISVKVTASRKNGVARRVVVRAGDQVWQATVVAESMSKQSEGAEVTSEGNEVTSEIASEIARLDGEYATQTETETRVEFSENKTAETKQVSQPTRESAAADPAPGNETPPFVETAAGHGSAFAFAPGASETPWIEGSAMDTLVHQVLSDRVVVRVVENDDGRESTKRVSARLRVVAAPRNHTVFAEVRKVAIAPTPENRDSGSVDAITLTDSGAILASALTTSNSTKTNFGGGNSASQSGKQRKQSGETVRGLGPGGACVLRVVTLNENGVSSFDADETTDEAEGWAKVLVNGNLLFPGSKRYSKKYSKTALKDGDVLSIALVAPDRGGDARSAAFMCVALDTDTSHGQTDSDSDSNYASDIDNTDDPAYVDDALANGKVLEDETALPPSQFASPGDAVVVFAVTVIARRAPPSPPPLSPPPPFPPADATLLGAAKHPSDSNLKCDEAGAKRRERTRDDIGKIDRTLRYPREYDASNAKPNLCGSSRPACGGGGVGDSTDAITNSITNQIDTTKDRDVLFVLDVSDAVTRTAFDTKLTELLLTLFCASHEGSLSTTGVLLYPAPSSTETCGSYQVAVPLGRYSTVEWFDAVENLRNDPTVCCGGAAGATSVEKTQPTSAAPLAEALDGALLEFETRGVHEPTKRLAVVIQSGTPAPAIKDEACSETASDAFSSMSRTFPFQKSALDGGVVDACTYAWKYVPAAARRLEVSGARIAGVNVAGDGGSDGTAVSEVQKIETHASSSLYGYEEDEEVSEDDASSLDESESSSQSSQLAESWRGAAGTASFLGAPWPNACHANGRCALSTVYGGENGRWVYAADDDETETSSSESTGGPSSLGASFERIATPVEISRTKRVAAALGRASVGAGVAAESAALGAAKQLKFRYDPGTPETCLFDLPLHRNGRNALAIVSQPASAHLVTIHEWGAAGSSGSSGSSGDTSSSSGSTTFIGEKVNARVARLMCEPSRPHMCSLPEDDGPSVVLAQCAGASVPSQKTHDDTLVCLRGLVNAVCGRTELGFNSDGKGDDGDSDDTSTTTTGTSTTTTSRSTATTSSSTDRCFPEGRLLHDAEASERGLVYGTVACNRVCQKEDDSDDSSKEDDSKESSKEDDSKESSKEDDSKESSPEKSLFARVEIDFQCAPGETCTVGATRTYTAGQDADTRRRQTKNEVEHLFPKLDVAAIVALATPPPPAFDASQGYGIHGR